MGNLQLRNKNQSKSHSLTKEKRVTLNRSNTMGRINKAVRNLRREEEEND
jgi:hypothetical protein